MDPELPDDFAAEVLRRTSGSACEAAEPLLTAFVDQGLGHAERELVGGHVQSCRACGALARVLAGLAPDLRSLAEAEPDPAFTHEVLAATCDAVPETLPRDARWRGRLRVLLLRPRFSMEAAFAASVLFGLLVGVPRPQVAVSQGAAIVDELRSGASRPLTAAHRIWDRAADPIGESFATAGRVLLRTARNVTPQSQGAETGTSSGDNR